MTTWCTCARPRSSINGTRARIDFTSARADRTSPLGLRDRATGQLVKARVERDGGYLLFRGLANRRVEQLVASADDVARRELEPAR